MKKQIEYKTIGAEALPSDFHTHVLPCMDDGSHSVEESLEMLRSFHLQGGRVVVATPHFYPDRESPSDFIERREKSVRSLLQSTRGMENELPSLCLGAEVAYFNGIAKSDAVGKLCIVGTDTILVEMPIEKWSNSVVDELIALKRVAGLNVVIAHIERYAKYQDASVLGKMNFSGIVFQVNCEVFGSFFDRRFVLKMIREEKDIVLGTDCHDNFRRRPDMSLAYKTILRKYGQIELERIEERCALLLNGAQFVLN